jgi:hypothetical protein
MRRIVLLLLGLILLTMSSGSGVAYLSAFGASPQHRDEPPPPDPTFEKMRKAAEKQRNEQRQSDLKKDTDQLYKLAQELKKSVDNSNEHVLSVEVIRKADEIEKLAKSVRNKMKADGYGSTIPD